jgi:hypothetical protein
VLDDGAEVMHIFNNITGKLQIEQPLGMSSGFLTSTSMGKINSIRTFESHFNLNLVRLEPEQGAFAGQRQVMASITDIPHRI